MGFGEAISAGLKNFYNPKGRASRSAFWWYFLFMFIISCVLGVIGGFVSGNGGIEQTWVGILFDILAAVLSVSYICAEIRRLHDINKSGWNICWALIPVLGGLYVLYLLCKPSFPNPNKYGA